VVIAGAVRTAIGRGHPEKGAFRGMHPADLLATVFGSAVERSGVDPADVQDVVAGCVNQFGEQGLNIGRNAWLQAGLPQEAPAATLDLQCGSSQQAVGFATAQIASGLRDCVVAGGVEHMGHIPLGAVAEVEERWGHAFTPALLERYKIVGQGLGAEMIAAERGQDRTELDRLALESHRRAAAATEAGAFRREIVAVTTPEGETVDADQGIRPETSLERLAALKPVFKEDGVVTAGNASQISDGASALVLASRERAAEAGLTPRATIVDHLTVGCDPVKMLEGPMPATKEILARNGLTIDEIDLVEINEAFAPVVAAWAEELGGDMDRVNVRGGAMALGHPLGGSGARLLTTLLHALEDEDKELGLVTMCAGGGIGTATLIRRTGG
jgi:acetyl-CoA acyltransferase